MKIFLRELSSSPYNIYIYLHVLKQNLKFGVRSWNFFDQMNLKVMESDVPVSQLFIRPERGSVRASGESGTSEIGR